MHRWQRILAAAAAVVGAAALGVALRDDDAGVQAMTLTAVQGPAQDAGHYTFTVRAAPVDGLVPGTDRRLVLTLDNPYDFDLLVTDLRADLVATSRVGCAPVPANLEVRRYTGELPVRVDAGDSREAGSVPLHMPNTVVDACQRATFTIALDASATRATP
ncbi:hypothetical protein [Krasilnikovia sp. MM14-A1259]|uniref:hypothetical protein n=1 Tax=Krasilnikovia sp. MM14-A1259 TaxID=3373539 RepID=UPI00382CC14B